MALTQEQGTVPVDAKDLHGVHHAEILVFTRDQDGPGGSAMVYNTLGVTDEVTDEQFDAQFRALDPQALAKEFHGDVVVMNGPRRALMDRFTASVLDNGKITMVGPIPMRTVATMRVPDLGRFLTSERPPYTEMTVARTTEWFFNTGRQVYQLVNPAGHAYIMQSASRHVDADLTTRHAPHARRAPATAGGMGVSHPHTRKGLGRPRTPRRRRGAHRPGRVREQLPAHRELAPKYRGNSAVALDPGA